MPLVLAVHATRPVADVPTAAARDLVRRSARDPDLTRAVVRARPARRRPGRGRRPPPAATADDLLDRVRADDDLLAIVPATAVDATVRVLTVGGRHPLRDPQRYPLEHPGRRSAPVR